MPNLALALAITLSFSAPAFAKRYVVPHDDQVLIEINAGEQRGLSPDNINVLVWNMYKGDKKTWERDFRSLSRGRDIMLLQEIYLDYQMSHVFYEQEEYGHKMATSFIDTKKRNSPSGVSTASRVEPADYFWVRSLDREPLIKTPKMLMFAEYPIEGHDKNVMTVNIHAINFVSAAKLGNMLGQIEDVLKDHDGPIILGGDFNTWSDKKTKLLMNMAKRLGLTEVTFPDDGRMRTFGRILDYVFVRDFDVIRSKVYGDIAGSDHKALEVELRLSRSQRLH
jgi:endonuclease/exonuclease/phosphatase (EEP) superfamily protein YafD